MGKIGKRIVAMCLTAALVFTNMGGNVKNVYAASGTSFDFIVAGSDFIGAIKDMIGSGAEPVKESDLDFTDGKLEKYYQLFFDGQEPLYEFYPEFEGQDMEAEVRAFIRLPGQVDDEYTLTGKEEIIFLYINNGESTISCSTVIEKSDGDDKKTKRVSVKAYEDAFDGNRIDLGASGLTSEKKTDTDKADTDKTDGTDGQLPEDGQMETEVLPGDRADTDQTESGTRKEEAEQSDPTEAEKDDSHFEAVEEADEPEEPEEAGDVVEDRGEGGSGEPVALYSRHMVPRVAVEEGEGSPESQPAEQEDAPDQAEPYREKETEKELEPVKEDAAASPADTGKAAEDGGMQSAQATEASEGAAEQSTAEESTAQAGPTEETAGQTDSTEETAGQTDSTEETAGQTDSTEETAGQTDSTEESTTASGTTQESTSQAAPDAGGTVATPSEPEPETPEATPSTPENPEPVIPSIGYGDLVGISGCSTAKAYITTLNKLEAMEDIDGYSITYEVTPASKGSILSGPNSAAEGESITFGVKAEEGYRVASVEADGCILEPETADDGSIRYTLEAVEADQNILITMEESGEFPAFYEVLNMEDGMDITISADPGVLPEETVVTADIVTGQVEDTVLAEGLKEGQEVIAAPAYDINLWLNGEKLDNEAWNRNGHVNVRFSGSLMERLSQEAETAQVLWVKDQGGDVEAMEGSETQIPEGRAIEALDCNTSHFTTFVPVLTKETADAGRVFDIEKLGLMDAGYPKLSVMDKNNKPLDVLEIKDADGTIKIMLKGEGGKAEPLPRDIQTRFDISYAMENSTDSTLKDYSVVKGDSFTYEFPANIIYEALSVDVRDSASKTIGRADIEKDGSVHIVITEPEVGKNFRGTAGIYGSMDLTGENEGKTEIVIKEGEIEKTLVFEPAPVVEKYSATVQKSYLPSEKDDTKYSKEGIPEAVRFHVVIKADEGNTGDLTDLKVTDKLSDDKKGNITYDTEAGIEIEFVTEGSSIDKVEFGASTDNTQIPIRLLKEDGTAADMKPGEELKFSYWMKLDPKAWSNNVTGGETEKVKASLQLAFKNTVTVERDGTKLGEGRTEFARTIEVISKSGITHYNEPINGEGDEIPVFIEYHVYVNPNLLNLTGWTVKDTLNKGNAGNESQKYLGKVTITAYDKSGKDAVEQDVYEVDPYEVDPSGTAWEWEIKAPGNYYYDIQYYTTVDGKPKGSNLNNEILLYGPAGSGFPGVGGGTQIGFLYNTYTLSKKNLSSQMMDNSYLPVDQGKPGVIGWEGDFGTIRWQTVLTPYSDGRNDVEGAVIPKDAVYEDQLTVIQYNNQGASTYTNIHTFNGLQALEDSFTLVDGKGNSIRPDAGVYELSLDQDNRGFSVTFDQVVRGPVTIEYNSYVNTDDFENLSGSLSDNLRFKNTAKLKIMGSEWVRWASQPYFIDDYLSKKVDSVNAGNGTVTWKLDVNKGYGSGRAPQDLGELGEVNIIETIPEGMIMSSIILRDGSTNYTLNEDIGDYDSTITGNQQTVTIYLNKIAENHDSNIMKKHIQLDVITKVTDPVAREFENKAQMIIGGVPLYQVSAKTGMDKSFLEKGMEYSSATAPSAVYTILVNKPGAHLSDTTLRIVDSIEGEKMVYLPDSMKIVNADTSEPIPGVAIGWHEQWFEITGLPDATPIKIVYKVMLNGAVGTSVNTRNSVKLYYGEGKYIEDSIEKEVYIVQAYATGVGNFSVRIYKTDQAGQPLEGAVFTLYKASGLNDPDMEELGTYSPVRSGDSQPAAALIQGLEKGQIYYLEETTVPSGYKGADGRYFVIPGSTEGTEIPDGVIKLENTGVPFIFENVKNQVTPPPTGGTITPGGGGSPGSGGTGGPGRYSSSPNGPGVTTEITPEQVPLAQWPEESAGITILDEDVPLAPLPKTGEDSHGYFLMTLISSIVMGLYMALSNRKKEE